MIRVLIAASSAVLRTGLTALVTGVPGIEVAGAFPDLSAVDDLRPDVVLATGAAEEIAPPLHGDPPAYVLLGGASQTRWTRDALRLGVRAVLPPDAPPSAILAALEAVANGLAVIDPSELGTLLSESISATATADTPDLTPRELEVLALMAEGAANKVIAWKLNISESTAKFHVASVLAKLNASSRTEAVTTGIRKGLVLI